MESKQTELLNQVACGVMPSAEALVALLQVSGPLEKELYRLADARRQEVFGDTVYIRGIIEFSNHCRKNCKYCGIRGSNCQVERYRMTPDEIVSLALQSKHSGATTVVLQSGEDPYYTTTMICEILRRIKTETPVEAITLSIGERSPDDYQAFVEAGCDRYLLRFETGNRRRFQALHPDDDFDRRLQCLDDLRRAGMQVGSGFMIGLPEGGLTGLAEDILFATRLELDMIGCGPFVPHAATPLAMAAAPADTSVYFKTMALLRLLNPHAHIPATTAFDAVFKFGRDQLLQRGANVFMPNLTPPAYRGKYLLYPNKPCVDENAAECGACTLSRLIRLGRKLGTGPGHAIRCRTQEVKP